MTSEGTSPLKDAGRISLCGLAPSRSTTAAATEKSVSEIKKREDAIKSSVSSQREQDRLSKKLLPMSRSALFVSQSVSPKQTRD